MTLGAMSLSTPRPTRSAGRTRLAVVLALLPLLALALVGPRADAAPATSSGTAARASVTVTGTVVWTSNGRPIRGVTVYAYKYDGRTRLGSGLTDGNGRFRISTPGDEEEFGIYVQGKKVGYAYGWVGCDKTLKPTFGAACTHSAAVGKVKIKKA